MSVERVQGIWKSVQLRWLKVMIAFFLCVVSAHASKECVGVLNDATELESRLGELAELQVKAESVTDVPGLESALESELSNKMSALLEVFPERWTGLEALRAEIAARAREHQRHGASSEHTQQVRKQSLRRAEDARLWDVQKIGVPFSKLSVPTVSHARFVGGSVLVQGIDGNAAKHRIRHVGNVWVKQEGHLPAQADPLDLELVGIGGGIEYYYDWSTRREPSLRFYSRDPQANWQAIEVDGAAWPLERRERLTNRFEISQDGRELFLQPIEESTNPVKKILVMENVRLARIRLGDPNPRLEFLSLPQKYTSGFFLSADSRHLLVKDGAELKRYDVENSFHQSGFISLFEGVDSAIHSHSVGGNRAAILVSSDESRKLKVLELSGENLPQSFLSRLRKSMFESAVGIRTLDVSALEGIDLESIRLSADGHLLYWTDQSGHIGVLDLDKPQESARKVKLPERGYFRITDLDAQGRRLLLVNAETNELLFMNLDWLEHSR